jgi:hypothetical protein
VAGNQEEDFLGDRPRLAKSGIPFFTFCGVVHGADGFALVRGLSPAPLPFRSLHITRSLARPEVAACSGGNNIVMVNSGEHKLRPASSDPALALAPSKGPAMIHQPSDLHSRPLATARRGIPRSSSPAAMVRSHSQPASRSSWTTGGEIESPAVRTFLQGLSAGRTGLGGEPGAAVATELYASRLAAASAALV